MRIPPSNGQVFTSDLNNHKNFSELRKSVDCTFKWEWFAMRKAIYLI